MSNYSSLQSTTPTSTNIHNNPSQSISERNLIVYTGLALFAMFFGAGNIVFPLYVGANSGEHILFSLLGFLIAGVGVPFLGLIAISLYNGDYFAFFSRLGKIPALLMIVLLMTILGPLGAMPRTETTTFNTLLPYLPNFLQNNALFSLIYMSLASFLAYQESKVIKILGLFLSPVKLISFSCLVFLGLLYTENETFNTISTQVAFNNALSLGYNTMDLFAGILFCTLAFRSIQSATQENPTLNPIKLTLKACLIGSLLISLVYTGFMLVAHNHAATLQSLSAEQTIHAISTVILGKWGGLFVCIAVSFACLATTLALGRTCSQCLYHDILKERIPKQICFISMMIATYLVSNLGFQGIAKITTPIVNASYPALILLCILNILHKLYGLKTVKLPILIAIVLSIGFSFLKC